MYRFKFVSISIFLLVSFIFCNISNAESALTSQEFIDLAAIRGISEVETAKIAFAKSTLPEVKAYAQLMMVEQMASLMNLRAVAKAQHLHMYSETELKEKARTYIFQRINNGFEYSYAEMRFLERRKAVSLYRTAVDLKDVALRQYATSALPILMHHLYLAQTLFDHMNGKSLMDKNIL